MTHCKTMRFIRSQDGLAVLEFAITVPLLLLMLIGMVEFCRYFIIQAKVDKAAMTIADVSAQGTTITSAKLDNIVNAASDIMLPYGFGTSGFIIVSSVTQTGAYSANNPPKVNWQYVSKSTDGSWTQPSRIGTPGLTASLPGNITLNDKDNVIVAEVFYHYQPLVGSVYGVLSGSTVYQTGLYKPRLGVLSTLGALPFWETSAWRFL